MKTKLTVSIEPDLKLLFESTKGLHCKSYSEILEESVLKVVEEFAPASTLERVILERKEELFDLERAYSQAKLREDEIRVEAATKKEQQQPEKSILNPLIEENLEKQFPSVAKGIVVQLKKGRVPGWKKIADTFMFESPDAAQYYFLNRMQKEGYISA